ncbi:MAG TPA: TonB family protein [Burkholderiaceae bacterium]|nr:TonB family protein [Burkholderiaceae bacterium]
MDFAQHQRNPARHLVGVGGVVLLHIIIIYALVTGLARKVVEVVKGPIEVKVIEEVIKKPPPPPDVLPPPPKMAAPPPPFVPPPEVVIAQPPPAPTITAVTPEAPPAPQAPVIVKAPEAPPAPPAPPVRSASVACPNYKEIMQAIPYPREALLDNLQGDVVIEFTITGSGKVTDAVVKSSTNRVFNKVALNAVQRLTCQGQGQDVRVLAPIGFKIN